MMRSMFSGVAGLKTHQVKMDVIGNNIANVNTTAYKSSSINFSELLYQTQSRASGPNGLTGRAGINPKQIGLGVQSAAITNAITTGGATQNTGNPFDIKINGEAFFVVSDGKSNYFTRDGSFYVDAAGNLAMSSNGYNVMGWGVDEATQTIKKDTVQALRIMSAANMTYPPESTTEAYVDGILDKNEPDASTEAGKTMNLSFFDALGYSYTAKFAIKETDVKGEYTVELTDIQNSEGESLVDVYNVNSINDIAGFGGVGSLTKTELRDLITGAKYDPATQTYTKVQELEDVFSDFKANRISGIKNYQVKDPAAATGTHAAGDTITLTGKGSMSQKDLESVYKMIFVSADDPANHFRDDTTNPPTPGQDYYYYEEVDPADPTKKTPIYLTGDATDTTNMDNWKKALNITQMTSFTFNTDKGIEFEVEQDFTVAKDNTIYDGTDFVGNITQEEAYGVDTSDPNKRYSFVVAENGKAQVTTTTAYNGHILKFNTDTGKFISIGNQDSATLDFNASATTKLGTTESLANFTDINIDWTNVTWFDNGGASTMTAQSGTEGKGLGSGRKLGNMSGVTIQNNGEIYGVYDNGMTKLLGQIAVAKFANAAGLEKAGDNLYSATLNSGEFDGIGVDITADGAGSMTTGALEMSNVDLSSEFTHMITTQRGFQANSRIITVSDTLLEELINLKR